MPNNLPKGNPIPEDILRKLYIEQKKSLAGVASALSVSVHKVQYWMEKYEIMTRSISEAVYLKLNPDGEPFRVKLSLSLEEEKLKSMALGLYWGEGNKIARSGLRVTNSDPGVIKKFQEFLLSICQVRINKIGYYLQTFKDIDIDKAKHYWANSLSIDPNQIHTCKPVKSMGMGTYKKISEHGVMTIAFLIPILRLG